MKNGAPTLRTGRLLLRPWRDADLPAFAALNADAEVARFLGGPLTREASDALAAHLRAFLEENGWGLWAVEVPGVCAFAGFTGLSRPRFAAPFTPCVEVGWRLAAAQQGRGYATEAARAAVRHGFDAVGLAQLVSFTTADNGASRRVMEKLGMTHDAAEDFDHPSLPEGHPLRRHVLYRLGR